MKVTAALSWWNESPADLDACVQATIEIADRIVALDGAYRRYPGGTAASDPAQAAAIRQAAANAGLECLVLTPDRLWAGQVEKRSYLLAAASVDTDWLAIIDTDHIIRANRDEARAALARMPDTVDIVSVPFYTPPNMDRPLVQSAATGWHREMSGLSTPLAHLFRALPGMRVEKFHWWYSAIKGGERVSMAYGSSDANPAMRALPVYPLDAAYRIEHRTLLRDEEHILANRAFCNDRVMVVEKTGQEDDVLGLPPPVFDYVTVPY